MRLVKSEPEPDFSVLCDDVIKNGRPCPNTYAKNFQNVVRDKLLELNFGENESTTSIYDKLCKAVKGAAQEVLPKAKKKRGTRRKVSKATRDLYDKEERKEARSKEQCEKLKEKRKNAGLTDFKIWVQECADRLNVANGQGDTSAVHNIVSQMEGKPGKPSKNLTTDGKGNLLVDATAVANRWFTFLKKKFSATTAEQGRPPMPELPQAVIGNTLSEEEALAAMHSKAQAGQGMRSRWNPRGGIPPRTGVQGHPGQATPTYLGRGRRAHRIRKGRVCHAAQKRLTGRPDKI